jgi:hypothetical protein
MIAKHFLPFFIIVASWLSFPAHSIPIEPAIDGIRLGMNFATMRAAKPHVKWSMTPVKSYARRGFARVLAAQDAVTLNGQKYDLLAVRGPKAEMAALHFARPAVKSDKKSCENSVAGFVATVVDVAQLKTNNMLGAPPPKLIEEPRIWGIMDKYIYGIKSYGVVECNVPEYYDFATENGPAGTTLRPDWIDSKTHKSWNLFNWDQDTLTSIFVEFNPDLQNGDSGLCRVGFSQQHGGSETIYLSPAPVEINVNRTDLRDGGNLAERYRLLTRRGSTQTPSQEKGIYRCSISPSDNIIEYCAQQGIPSQATSQTLNFASDYLKTYKINIPKIDEDDFALRSVIINFSFNDQDVVPTFNWDNALTQKLPKDFILVGRPQISSDDFPTSAIQQKVDATVYFDCVILSDLSVYCGRARVEPDTAKPLYEGFMSSLLTRRFKNIRAELKDGQNINTANRYFHYVARFIVPK